MNKKLMGMIIGGTITLSALGYATYTTIENNNLTSSLNEKDLQLKNKEDRIKSLENEKIELINEKELIKETNRSLNKKNEDLEKTLKEVLPTSIDKLHFNPNNLTEKSNANVARLNEMLKNTGLKGLGSAYKKVEDTYGVNAIFLISLTAEESGWGRSRRAVEDNNLSGFEVYQASSKGAKFDSKYESIIITGKLLGNLYLKSDGKYYKGKDIYSVNTTYCPVNGYTWSNNIISIANDLMER